MFKFFKNKDSVDSAKNNNNLLIKTAALFIHAAKIDENYTNKEKVIIKIAIVFFTIIVNLSPQKFLYQ